MKVQLVGKRQVSYTQKKTGELKEGVELFYIAAKRNVQGKAADTLWIGKQSEFYADVLNLDLTNPIDANVVNEVPPGSRFPEITEITVIEKK